MSASARNLLMHAFMSRPALREIASSASLQAWATSCPVDAFQGVCRVESQNATYLFQNGRCFAVSGRGARAGTTSPELVGMRIAGWLVPGDDVRVSRTWRVGARAVLIAAAERGRKAKTALTSQVIAFSQFNDGLPAPRAHALDLPPTPTLTRIGVAMPAA
jgi:hypothetical protein